MKNLKQYIFVGIFAIALMFVGGYFQSCTQKTEIAKYKEQLQTLKDSSEVVLRWSDSVKAASDARVAFVMDSTKRINDSLDLVVAKRSRQLSVMRKKNDEVLELVRSDTGCNTVCQMAVQAAENYRAEADTAKAQAVDFRHKWELSETNLLAMTEDRDNQLFRADSLDHQLKSHINLPPPKDPDKLFNFIPLPSSTKDIASVPCVSALQHSFLE